MGQEGGEEEMSAGAERGCDFCGSVVDYEMIRIDVPMSSDDIRVCSFACVAGLGATRAKEFENGLLKRLEKFEDPKRGRFGFSD